MTTAGISTQRDPDLLGQTVIVIGGIRLETAWRAGAEGATLLMTP